MTAGDDVWVLESGDYEQWSVLGVFSGPEAAETFLRATYGPPYIVTWEWDGEGFDGRFESVPGYSTKHGAYYALTKYALDPRRMDA